MSADLALYLDVQGTQDDVHPERGIPRYIGNHTRALVARPGAVSRNALNPTVTAPAQLDREILSSSRLVWNTPDAFRQARVESPLAYHVMSPFHLHRPFEASLPPHAFDADALVVTLYDLIPLHHPATYLRNYSARLYQSRLALVQSADLVLTLSNHTSADAVERLGLAPSHVVNIGAGVSPYFRRRENQQTRRARCASVNGLSRPFVMSVSGHDARKNTALVLRAFAQLPMSLRRALQVVVVGEISPDVHREYRRVAREAGCPDDEIVWAGRVSDDTLRALYQTAEVFVFPSVLEGFGLPVLEAAACGCPALTARACSLPEILEWEPSTFDPYDVDELVSRLELALTDTSFRAELNRRGDAAVAHHTWDAVADRTIDAVAGVRRSRRAHGPLRIALIGALGDPPDLDTVRIARELGHLCELDVYATDHSPSVVEGVSALPVEAFDRVRTPHAYDAIVYALGPRSDPQVHNLARHTAGVVWLRAADGAAEGAVEVKAELVASARALVAPAREQARDAAAIARALVAAASVGAP
jgi:glycosyltransferase involved in cell wall biosynthesis